MLLVCGVLAILAITAIFAMNGYVQYYAKDYLYASGEEKEIPEAEPDAQGPSGQSV